MLINLLVGLPTMLVCLTLQALFTFWSIRFYVRQSRRAEGPLEAGNAVLVFGMTSAALVTIPSELVTAQLAATHSAKIPA